MNAEIDELSAEATAAKDFLEKVDIRKKVDEKKKQLFSNILQKNL